ncbi:hypothetical protein RCS94_06410 [Orbaceae bacterium ac157xtp]
MTNNKILDTRPVNKEILTAKEFLSLIEKNPEIIKRSSPAPAKLGSNGFGGICVEYSKPIYKVAY